MPAVAQDDEGELTPVVITGSNIPTVELEGPSPIVRIDREEINRSGAETVGELLRRLPQNNSGSYDEKNQNSFTPGSSGVSLRGMGMGYSLVLLNGRRMAAYPLTMTTSFTDLNSVPMAVVERIEVLLDGASAIYGSDAIAGVVNIITREDFEGVEINAGYSNTTDRDAGTQTYSITGGTVAEEGSAWVNISYLQRNAVAHGDRDFSKSAVQERNGGIDFRSSAGNPGSIKLLGGDGSAYDSGFYRVPLGSSGMVTAEEIIGSKNEDGSWTGGGRNYFDYGPWQSLSPELERTSVSSRVNYNLTDNIKGFLETSHQSNRTVQWMAPTPAFGDVYGYTVSADNPFNPFGEEVSFRHRLIEAGSRIFEIDTDIFRVLPGIDIDINEKWSAQAAFLHTTADSFRLSRNMISADAFQDALNSSDPNTAYNVFGDATNQSINSPEVIDSLKVESMQKARVEMQQVDARVWGELAELPGGTLGVVFGVEARQEEAWSKSDPFSRAEKIIGSGGTASAGSRDLTSGYGEFQIPIIGGDNEITGIRALSLQVAGRVEQYSDFGNTSNPKIGLSYRPIDRLLLRATYQEGFKAPTLQQLYMAKTVSHPFLVDPARKDQAQMQYRTISGGNEDLQPENSENVTVGAVVDIPMPENMNLTVMASWGSYDLESLIATVSPQFMLHNEERFKDKIIRNEQTAEDKVAGIPGSISEIRSGYQNLAQAQVEVVDISVEYELDTTVGAFTWNTSLANIYNYDWQPKPGDPFMELAGTFQRPEWRGNTSLWWTYDKYSIGATVNYVDSFDQENYSDPGTRDWYGLTKAEVDSLTTLDLQASYQITDSALLRLGARNVTNEMPPWSDENPEGFALGAPGHSVLGAVLYANVSVRF
jgi:outer membrane receptor protein involved in Fe transport